MRSMLRSTARLFTALGCAAMLAACEDDSTGPDLAAPTGVIATASSATSVTVTFAAVIGATGYIVQRAPASGDFATVGTPTEPTYTDNELTASTVYRYRVAARSGSDESDFSSEVAVTTQATGPKVATIATDITASRMLFADTVYTIRGFIKVANGATLTIQPGTVIQGDFNTVGSSLFVLRGARIDAQGTAAAPIVFTSSRPVGQRQAGDWGGLIIVGNGVINRGSPVILEGTNTGASNPAVDYSGGGSNTDSSGTLRYVRIEFAGYGTAADQELNTLTMAAVGSGTTIEYVQALYGLDDSFEWFGGAVDAKYLVSYEAGDDHFDMSEGYVGRIQHAIAFQSRQIIPRPAAGNVASDPEGIENDGCNGANCTNGQSSTPLTIPMIANFTLIGPPTGVFTATSGAMGAMLRRGTGGYYVNGVIARWERAALSLRDQTTLDRITAGELQLKNLYLAGNGATFQPASGATVQGTVDLAANGIEVGGATPASLFTALPLSPTIETQLDWSPSAASPIASGGMATFSGALATKAGTFISGTAYRGAAAPGGAKWWTGWTRYAVN
jgi:hypothetical protein